MFITWAINLVKIFSNCVNFSVCQDAPKKVKNGKVKFESNILTNKPVVGTKVSFQCNYEYKLSSKVTDYICQKDGTWNNEITNLECKKGNLKLKIIKLIIWKLV